MYRLIVLLAFYLFVNSSALANTLPEASELYQASTQTMWLRLLHFNGEESYVDDEKFFLHEQGKWQPALELEASLLAFKAEPEKKCQFPARFSWLKAEFPDWFEDIVEMECAEYEQWRTNVQAHSTTLVLAASFLNSPSSMYGHTFLRFDPESEEQGVSLTSYAVNFGAAVGEDSGGFMYAARGLFGGYQGYFSDGPYYEKVQEYSRLDNRDMWEYKLNLTPEETDRLLTHLWELKDINFDYFFFDENCSFRLLELLEVARPEVDLTSDFSSWAIPVDTVLAVNNAAMVESRFYRPSNQSKLQFNIDLLNDSQSHMALQLVEDSSYWESDAIQALTGQEQYNVASVAYQHIRYMHNRTERNQQLAKRSFFLLQKIQSLAQYAQEEKPVEPSPPEIGHDTGLIALSYGYGETGFVDLSYRGSYHDLLDNLDAYPQYTALNMARFVFRYDGHKLQLQELGAVEIASLNPRTEFFKPISWRVNVGLERQWTEGDDELVFQGNAGGGWTSAIADSDWLAYSLFQARLEFNAAFEHKADLAAGASLGLLYQSSEHAFNLELSSLAFTDKVYRDLAEVSYQWALRQNTGLRLSIKRILNDDDHVTESSVSMRLYF